jgi:sodium pump decarboxylase gamma subunit
MDLASWFVCLLGVGIVFLGLICLIFLCKIISLATAEKSTNKNDAPAKQTAPIPATAVIENRAEIIAAVSAALAEELGEDVSSIRILSFRKIGG